jgi:DNA polymerase-1
MTKTRLLVDGDHLFYKQAAACEREQRLSVYKETSPGVWEVDKDAQTIISLDMVLEQAISSVEASLSRYKHELKADETVLVFSGSNNFRKELWDGYKLARKATRKPVGYFSLIEHFRDNTDYPVVFEDCLEGDDYIGILSTRPSSRDNIIVSGDKDMQTLPDVRVSWFDSDPKLKRDYKTTKESAYLYWMGQTLTGDSTDGYKGCPGLGPVGAKAVLDKGAEWRDVVSAFEKGCEALLKKERKTDPTLELCSALTECNVETPEELALLNARMARILRFTDWDKTTRRPILWEPE